MHNYLRRILRNSWVARSPASEPAVEGTPVPIWARFTEPGDVAVGWVKSVNLNSGSKGFDGSECGLLILRAPEGVKIRAGSRETITAREQEVLVNLDKSSLRGAVQHGIQSGVGVGSFIKVSYLEDRESALFPGQNYKAFGLRRRREFHSD